MPRLLAATLALTLSCSLAIPANAAQLRPRAGAYELQVLVDGRPVRSFGHDGDTWLLGQLGARYTLRVINRSAHPIEAVVSVDGRDVIDGDTASPQKGGYLVHAYGSVDIDGWRISASQAAAFRFSSVSDSYAARVGSGREVGVIGVAVFEEKRRPPPPPPVHIVPRDDYSYSCCSDGIRGKAGAPEGRLESSNQPAPSMREQLDDGEAAPAPARSAPMQEPSTAAAPPPASAQSALSGAGGQGYADSNTRHEKKKERAGLGTEYGESVNSQIYQVAFERATAMPQLYLGVHYNDRDGLIALGIDVDGESEQALRQSANPFPVNERFAPPPPNWRQ